jgi:hypothetical protein
MDQKKETTRRDFGKGALWVAHALTVLLAASSQPASAESPYSCTRPTAPV